MDFKKAIQLTVIAILGIVCFSSCDKDKDDLFKTMQYVYQSEGTSNLDITQ